MNKQMILLTALTFLWQLGWCQSSKRRLPQNINVPIYSHIFPAVSGDGNQMIYLTNYTNSEGFEVRYTSRTGSDTWSDPVPIPSINRPALDHIGSFCLSHDGNTVVFSSRRTPGIGNYDIWISEKKGNSWSPPQNPGKPLNSPAHEGNPCLSPDGRSLYFMRCETMDNTRKSNCRLFVSQRQSATRWSEAVELPWPINTGHETTPRILADNKTLVFASARAGGKGMLDLYMSRMENGQWTQPVPLDFLNTPENDEYVSIPARGDVIYYNELHRGQQNIVMASVPEPLRPAKVLMLDGTVRYTDGKNAADDILIQVYNAKTNSLFTSTRLRQHDSGFSLFLPEGVVYDFSAFPQSAGHAYYSQLYDLTFLPQSRRETPDIELDAVKTGLSIPLTTIRFEGNSTDISTLSNTEFIRIAGFLKRNPGVRVQLNAYIDHVLSDTLQTGELTEIVIDTVWQNSSVLHVHDTVREADDAFFDENLSNNYDNDTEDGNEEIAEYKLHFSYHNDRTRQQAEAVKQKLIDAGVPEHLIEAEGRGDQWQVDLATEDRNYWIELVFLMP